MKKYIILIVIVSLVVMSSGCTGMFHPISADKNWQNQHGLGTGNITGMIQNIAVDSSSGIKTLDVFVDKILR